MTGLALVWGNCQAAPVAELVAGPLRRHDVDVVAVPPVYLATPTDLSAVHEAVRRCAVLISQPIGTDYPVPGSSTEHLATLLPAGAQLITFPVVYDTGPFPWQVHGHGRDGARVDAPVTDYHDLRVLVAARRGLTVDATMSWWPHPSQVCVRDGADRSRRELQRRERSLDVAVSDLLGGPDALWTMTHPANRILAAVAQRILGRLGIHERVRARDVEYLGQRRAPVETSVARALDHPARPEWLVDGAEVPLARILDAQLRFYASRPDVVAETLWRHASRLRALGLGAD